MDRQIGRHVEPNGIVRPMSRRLQRFRACARLGLVLAGLLTSGCATTSFDAVRAHAARGDGALLASVPFIPQATQQCGPAALAMVLRYWGAEVDVEELGRALVLPSAGGALTLELEFQARRRGFRARAVRGTLDVARRELRQGRPLIVFQDLGAGVISVPHFAVLVGFDDRAEVVVLHSGTTAFHILSYDAFRRTWEAQRGWTLLVTRPDAPA